MSKKTLALSIAVLTFAIGVILARIYSFAQHEPSLPPAATDVLTGNYHLSGPYTHKNLKVFLVHGPDQPNQRHFIPLQEAMERKLVMVHETGEVNELSIENVSSADEVFVQAGDIVKGGQQDRVLTVDLILPAQSGTMAITAFCVERGRWDRRGTEPKEHFTISSRMAVTKDPKVAARELISQPMVWDEVENAQSKLSGSLNSDVASVKSRSSLQLSTENEKVLEAADGYVKALSSIVEGSDVIGFSFAINDQPNSGEVYYSHAFFTKLWPKLLLTTAIEAVAELANDKQTKPASAVDFRGLIENAEQGSESISNVNQRTSIVKREAERSLFFETRDLEQSGAWVHRSYLWR